MLKVRVVPVKAYHVRLPSGNRLPGLFVVESEWEGMARLNGRPGEVLVIEKPSQLLEMFAQTPFGKADGVEAYIIKASPSLMDLIQKDDVAGAAGAEPATAAAPNPAEAQHGQA